MIYRQGDVLIKKVDEIPKNLKKKNNILAYGEVIGHKHQFVNQNVTTLVNNQEQQYIDVQQDSILQHEEHDNITIEKGKYIVIQLREVDLLGEVRQVLD
jgi:hypothetical protein